MFLTATGVQFLCRRRPVRQIFMPGSGSTILSMAGITMAVAIPSPTILFAAALFREAAKDWANLAA
ncbi:hypothetical protein [Sphingomonas sp. GM_Shp_2]|uniref:hypothetical protein n=1 Tax=Sphingomonas sp. GM_Shp_2 TaxID=2937380 RepID=UPI00226ADE2D|nr:hypothetical protein [Sphingomonas sp. GM_Shp_2]